MSPRYYLPLFFGHFEVVDLPGLGAVAANGP